MTTIRTFGRFPTLGEMKAYYNRDDVLNFLYQQSQLRETFAAPIRVFVPNLTVTVANVTGILSRCAACFVVWLTRSIPNRSARLTAPAGHIL